jgi:hypothetical protein
MRPRENGMVIPLAFLLERRWRYGYAAQDVISCEQDARDAFAL